MNVHRGRHRYHFVDRAVAYPHLLKGTDMPSWLETVIILLVLAVVIVVIVLVLDGAGAFDMISAEGVTDWT